MSGSINERPGAKAPFFLGVCSGAPAPSVEGEGKSKSIRGGGRDALLAG